MMNLMQMASLGLMAFGGAALAAALGGGLAAALKWQGGRMVAVTGASCVAGLAAGVAFGWTGAPIGGLAGKPALPPGAQAVWNLDVIAQHYPADYAKIAAILDEPAERGASASELRAATEIPSTLLLLRQMPYIDHDNALAELRLETESLKVMLSQPGACKRMMSPGLEAVDPETMGPPDLMRRARLLEHKILEQTAIAPAPIGDLADARLILARLDRQALQRLSAADRDALIPVLQAQGTPATDAEWRADCHFVEGIFAQMAAEDDDTKVALYKALAVTAAERQHAGT